MYKRIFHCPVSEQQNHAFESKLNENEYYMVAEMGFELTPPKEVKPQ